jgi:hypothetical protein
VGSVAPFKELDGLPPEEAALTAVLKILEGLFGPVVPL